MITPDQIKAARKLLGWSIATLAQKADRKFRTIANAEAGTLQPRYQKTTLPAVRAAIEAAGVEFVNGGIRLSGRPPSATTRMTAAQIQESRRLLGWSQTTLSRTARLGIDVVRNAEESALVPRNAERQLVAIRRAFDGAGVEFTDASQPCGCEG